MKFGIDFRTYYQRHTINGIVRKYCIDHDRLFAYAFKDLYDEFYATYYEDLTSYEKGITGIDVAEEKGLLKELLEVAERLFGE